MDGVRIFQGMNMQVISLTSRIVKREESGIGKTFSIRRNMKQAT